MCLPALPVSPPTLRGMAQPIRPGRSAGGPSPDHGGSLPAVDITRTMRAQAEHEYQRQSARQSAKSADALDRLLDLQLANEAREEKMLFWARVAGWGALAAVLLSAVAIAVTMLLS